MHFFYCIILELFWYYPVSFVVPLPSSEVFGLHFGFSSQICFMGLKSFTQIEIWTFAMIAMVDPSTKAMRLSTKKEFYQLNDEATKKNNNLVAWYGALRAHQHRPTPTSLTVLSHSPCGVDSTSAAGIEAARVTGGEILCVGWGGAKMVREVSTCQPWCATTMTDSF